MTTTTAEKTTVAEKPAAAVAAVDKPVIAPDKRRALGRGLESLLPGGPRVVAGTAAGAAAAGTTEVAIGDLQAQAARAAAGETILHISLDAIDQNPYQTRCVTRESTSEDGIDSLHELAESIRANGVIQPITVRAGQDGRRRDRRHHRARR